MVCSACRKDIAYGSKHWVCSVSTCNRARTQLVFCSVSCWDSHVATLRHRDAWAVEAFAPAREGGRAPTPMPSPTPSPRSAPPAPLAVADETETLIVVSKMKKYVRERSGMNCSDAVAERLSDHVRSLCDIAIRNALAAERKTVLDRDVPSPR